ARAKPARRRRHLRHADDGESLGGVGRCRPGVRRRGRGCTTIDASQPISWQVMAEELAYDETGEPFLDLISGRDYAEAEGDGPDHELEHAVERELDAGLPAVAEATITRAADQGLDVELVALDAGEEPA